MHEAPLEFTACLFYHTQGGRRHAFKGTLSLKILPSVHYTELHTLKMYTKHTFFFRKVYALTAQNYELLLLHD